VISPFLLRRLRELHVVDAAAEQALERDGILTLADLELAIAEHRPAVAGDAFVRAAQTLRAEDRPMTLGRAWDVAAAIMHAIESQCPTIDGLHPSGALRRAEPLVHTLVIVGRAADPARAVHAIAELPLGAEVIHRTGRRLVLLFEGHEIDVRVCTPDECGAVLFATTGPAEHVADVLRQRGPHLARTEADVYTHAGLTYLPAEVRDSADALERARRGSVPRLIDRDDIRGDLHMHTTYSDGRDSLRQMVHAARALGYEYIAITDHSEHAGASRTLTLDQLARQAEEIARVREQVPDMAILHGVEVDILEDGSLDFPDRVLASLDVVLASLHESFGHDGRRLTKRCIAAIRHPLVSAITHPANQLVGRRPGYDLDYEAVYAAAAQTGTLLEVDGAPSHLDLPGERAREAVQAGVTLVIDSDCHRSPALDRQMRMGVGTARRGWVEPAHVLNTRPLADVRAFLARKRAGA
jgi:DNA polymerase (family 10)